MRKAPITTNFIIQWSKVDPEQYAGGLAQPGYPGDAGFDLYCSRTVIVPPSGTGKIPTNVAVALPAGFWAQIEGRSSTFFNRQLLVQTAVIDNGYRGELWCVVKNMSDQQVIVRQKERICQLILHELVVPVIIEVAALPAGDRGCNGFGSTDKRTDNG